MINRMKGQPFVFNQDSNDVDQAAPPGQAQEWIRDWHRRAFAAGAGVFVADVALPDVVETKDTPTGEICGARFSEDRQDTMASADDGPVHHDDHPERSRSTRWYRIIAELMAQGTDVLHLACEEARKADAIILGGMRMNDAHHGRHWQVKSNDPLVSQFCMEHPEWCNTWEDGSRDVTLNYAIPEVQAHRLQILREMATNYDIDGLELNWMRHCRHFPAGRQREYLSDLTHFVRQVREMLDEVAWEKAVERMILGHRVPATLEESLNIGCDVETWAMKGYADFLAPMDFLFNDLNVRTDEFVEAVKGTGCLVYPSFGSIKYSFGRMYDDNNLYEGKDNHRAVTMRSLDQFRATAANWYAWGASGGSCFNMYLWPPEQQRFYTSAIAIMSSPERAKTGPRHYIYLPVWKDHGDGVGPTGRFNCQGLTFGAGTVRKRQAFTFRMADGRNGEKLRGLVRFRIYDATLEDEFAIDLNGEAIHREKFRIEHQPNGDVWEEPSGPNDLPHVGEPEVFKASVPFSWPANLCFEMPLADCPPFKGDNELGLCRKNTAAGITPAPRMEVLEVFVEP